MSDLSPTFAALSSLFRDVLRLLQSGLVRTLLSEGECRDVAGGVRPESRMGVLISAEESREVLGRLGGGGGGLPRRRGGRAGGGESRCPRRGSPTARDGGAASRRSEVSGGMG